METHTAQQYTRGCGGWVVTEGIDATVRAAGFDAVGNLVLEREGGSRP